MGTESKTITADNGNLAPRIFCLQASRAFEKVLDENMEDPRLAISAVTSEQSKKNGGGWVPTYDARDSRV
ncbi:MAG: hypothetical protein AAB535_02840 [Patescibacteria group bacterium]